MERRIEKKGFYRRLYVLLILCIGSYVGYKISKVNTSIEATNRIHEFRVKGERWILSETNSILLLKNQLEEEKGELLIKGKIISSCIDDMDGDGTDEYLVIEGNTEAQYGEDLVIYTYKNGLKELLRQSFMNMNPWKVQSCDVDGDGEKEISVGVYKKTEFHPIMAKRPFIYNFHGNVISPKWRGSRLSRPFEDYIFADVDGDKKDEIVSLEILQDGRNVVNTYQWKGFGFEGQGESSYYEKINRIKKGVMKEGKYTVYANIKTATGSLRKTLKYQDGSLVEEIQ